MHAMQKTRIQVGIDDTDSTRGGCTTYIVAVLVERLEKLGAAFFDYPYLVRLNPNVPWKTRGNGALSLRVECEEKLAAKIKETVVSTVKEMSDLAAKGTDPGIVFLCSSKVPAQIASFGEKTTTGIATLSEAKKLISKFGAEAVGFNTRRGIIGALAAVGKTFHSDYTYELIAYRSHENIGTKRRVDSSSIFEMDLLTKPYTFNNVDLEKRRVIITPRGPDPILFGIRGESPKIVREAFEMVKPLEKVERWVIFRTNQGTDEHLVQTAALSNLRPYTSVVAKATVSQSPRVVPLRHVIFSVKDHSGETDCAAYEPTGNLRKVASALIVGDCVEIYGAVRKRPGKEMLTVNLEKINVLSLAPKTKLENPVCPKCDKRLESAGKGQGFRCKKCGAKLKQAQKVKVVEPRELKTGLYITSTRSQRHLTKPLSRYGLEKKNLAVQTIASQWHG
jgi:tRNA(Ile2)-agmatinylcytidine synthase